MDDKTINLQEYKENKRQAAIQQQRAWEEDYKEAVMKIAHTGDVKVSRYSTSDDEAVEKVLQGEMNGVVITEDRCVCCGKPVVEGRMVCEECERAVLSVEKKPLPPKTWERTPEERFGKKKKTWFMKLFRK